MIYRQGDIFLIRVNSVETNNVIETEDAVVGHGEVTGHMHVIVGEDLQWLVNAVSDINTFPVDGKAIDKVYVNVPEGGSIVHEEHDTIELPVGIYQITRQREYDPLTDERYVLD